MKRTATLVTAAALLAGLGVAISQGGGAKGAAGAAGQGDAARGAKAWADNCASCHNMRSVRELSDHQWAVAGAHMRVRANIPGDIARDIIAFLQASNSAAIPAAAATTTEGAGAALALAAGDPARGSQIYQETCVACHGENGKGALDGVPDLTAPGGRLSKPDDVLLRHIIDGFQSPGSPMPMPAKGGNPDLTDQDMANVLAYMRTAFKR